MTATNGRHGYDKCEAERRSGGPCERPAGWGTDHPGVGRCKLHGGCTPTHEAAALAVRRDQADAAALRELRQRGREPLGSPLMALHDLAAEVVQWQAILRGRVAELDSLAVRTDAGAEHVRAAVAAYERAMSRTADVLATLASLNIDERVLQLQHRTGLELVRAINTILARLGYPSPEADPAVRLVVSQELRELVGLAAV